VIKTYQYKAPYCSHELAVGSLFRMHRGSFGPHVEDPHEDEFCDIHETTGDYTQSAYVVREDPNTVWFCNPNAIDEARETLRHLGAPGSSGGSFGRLIEEVVGSDVPEDVIGKNIFEVGFSEIGCSEDPAVVNTQRDALAELLQHLGDDISLWNVQPEIRSYHNHEASAVPVDFDRKLRVDRSSCQWAVYGVVRGEEPPSRHYVPAGARIPRREAQGDQ
jgi:hypothetical protein